MIHKYKLMGLNIVLDVYSGAVHLIDDVFYDLLDEIGESFDKNADYSGAFEALKCKYSEEEIGRVSSWEPYNTQVTKGTRITVWISKGIDASEEVTE